MAFPSIFLNDSSRTISLPVSSLKKKILTWTASFLSSEQINRQIQSALFSLKFARDVWLEEKADKEEKDHQGDANDDDLFCDISNYSISKCDVPKKRQASDSFLKNGKTDMISVSSVGSLPSLNLKISVRYLYLNKISSLEF